VSAVKALPGVHSADGDLRSVVVTYDPAQVTVEQLSQAIEALHYRVVGATPEP